jgi:hypothetical protein
VYCDITCRGLYDLMIFRPNCHQFINQHPPHHNIGENIAVLNIWYLELLVGRLRELILCLIARNKIFNKELYLKVKCVYHNLITSGRVRRGYNGTRL